MIRKLLNNQSCAYGGIILLTFVLLAVFAPLIAPFSADEVSLANRLLPLSSTNWMGTDEMGRDIFSRVIFGTRYAFVVVALVTCIALPIGISVGVVAGYVGGYVEMLLMRITDIFLAFPKLILALAFVVMLGTGLNNAILAISITAWAPYARLTRSQTIVFKQEDYITALKLQGVSNFKMLCKYIAPLCSTSVIVQVSLDMSGFILAVAGLGFLGLGAQPPSPEWGAMISTGRDYFLTHWWLITFPGLAIFILSLGFNMLGEGVRDVLDPK